MLLTLKAFKTVGKTVFCRKLYSPQRFVNAHCSFLSSKPPYEQEKYVDLKQQSYLMPGAERIRATMLTRDPTKLISEVPGCPDIKTVFDTVCHGLKVSGDGPCAGMRNKSTDLYEWLSYSQVIEKSRCMGSAFVEMGLKPRQEAYVGVFAANRVEFLLTLYGCAGYSIIMIPLYDSLGAESVNFIIAQAELPFVIANNDKNALNVLKSAGKLPFLKAVVMMDSPTPEVISCAQSVNVQLMTFAELQNIGKMKKKDLVLPQPEDLFCIPYTSGTTGTPKGVMITHKNVVACISSLVIAYSVAGRYGGSIVSYLPPAHIYEIMNQVASMFFARKLAFFPPDINRLFEDIRAVKPNIIPFVPRLMNAFYSKVMDELKSSKMKSYIFHHAMSRKEKLLKKGVVRRDTIWDKFVFKKIQDVLGGNAHMIITTSAPISPDVMRFFRCATGSYIFEAYGQTEVLASTMTLPHETEGGSVGAPLPCNFVKLVDVPDMNYFAKNDEGEICYKGENVFKGYFKSPELTKECSDEDGWHHSGDIGRWLPNGALQIIDRKKHLFKLSQGEYIAPDKVENAYSQSEIVMQIFIDGFSTEDYVVGIVVPEREALIAWAKKNAVDKPFDELIKNTDVRIGVLRELHKYGKKADLNALEQAMSITFSLEPFTVENELLSPTLKMKRNVARKRYHHLLQSMYQEGPLITSSKK